MIGGGLSAGVLAGRLGQHGAGGGTTPPLLLRIGPADVTDKLRIPGGQSSFRISRQLNQRDSANFVFLTDVADPWVPDLGAEVHFTVGDTTEFAGFVFERERQLLSEGNREVWIRVQCVDWNALADYKIVNEVYEGWRAGAIARDLVAKYLAVEGVTADGVEDGPILARITFSNRPAAGCFDDLCELIGWHWNMDSRRVLHLFAEAQSFAPFDIVDGVNAAIRQLRVRESLAQYRNRQFLGGGRGITPPRTEFFNGDNARRTFTVEYPLAHRPTVKVNGVDATVGIRGVDTGKDWYWNENETELGQDPSALPLTEHDQLTVTSQGYYRINTIVEDPAAIAERQAIEGPSGRSGIYEHAVSVNGLDGESLVRIKGMGLVRRYGLDSEGEFETDVRGLAIGQQLLISVPRMGLTSATVLITSVDMAWRASGGFRYRVKVTSGELKGTAKEFWSKVFGGGQPLGLRENDIVFDTILAHDHIRLSDSPSDPLLADPTLNEWGPGIAGESEWEG